MPSAAYGMTHRAEEPQDQSNDQHDHADRPEDGDSGEKTDYEKNNAEDDHEASKVCSTA
jgi:hypothetical protein